MLRYIRSDKFKIAPHKQTSIIKHFFRLEDASLANGALCLSTPKHNGKSGTAHSWSRSGYSPLINRGSTGQETLASLKKKPINSYQSKSSFVTNPGTSILIDCPEH